MRDFLPEDVRRRQYVIGVIADVYQRYGFEPLETPAGREHRDPARQVRRRRRQADLQDPEARRGRRDRAGRPGAALRPDRAAGPGGRRVPRAACRSSSSATRCSRCGAPIGRRRAASASSTSATWTPSGRRRWWSKPSCWPPPATCWRASASRPTRSRLNHRGVLAGLLDAGGVPDGAPRRRARRPRQARQDRPRRRGGGARRARRPRARRRHAARVLCVRGRGGRRPAADPAGVQPGRAAAGSRRCSPARGAEAWPTCAQIVALVGATASGRAPAARPVAGARAVATTPARSSRSPSPTWPAASAAAAATTT